MPVGVRSCCIRLVLLRGGLYVEDEDQYNTPRLNKVLSVTVEFTVFTIEY